MFRSQAVLSGLVGHRIWFEAWRTQNQSHKAPQRSPPPPPHALKAPCIFFGVFPLLQALTDRKPCEAQEVVGQMFRTGTGFPPDKVGGKRLFVRLSGQAAIAGMHLAFSVLARA